MPSWRAELERARRRGGDRARHRRQRGRVPGLAGQPARLDKLRRAGVALVEPGGARCRVGAERRSISRPAGGGVGRRPATGLSPQTLGAVRSWSPGPSTATPAKRPRRPSWRRGGKSPGSVSARRRGPWCWGPSRGRPNSRRPRSWDPHRRRVPLRGAPRPPARSPPPEPPASCPSDLPDVAAAHITGHHPWPSTGARSGRR